MKNRNIGAWKCSWKEITFLLWILSCYEFEGLGYENGLVSRVSYALRNLRREYHPLGHEETFLQILYEIDATNFQVPLSTLWGDTLTNPKACRQYVTFLQRMRAGSPDDGIAGFLDRVDHPKKVSSRIQEMLHPYLPKLPFKPDLIEWDKTSFGPGSFSNEHKASPSTISKDLRLIWTFTRSCSYSKLANVPKNFKTDRLIASEPLENQLRQYPIARALMRQTEICSNGAICYHDQGNNRRRCLIENATADQSNASDNVQISHVSDTMPEWWPLLKHFRTDSFSYRENGKMIKKSLNPIFSTMGSFLTFPVESWVFYAYTYAILKICGATPAELASIAVYGDDVIIPRAYYPVWKMFMELLGFEINSTKSFWKADEPFRETCGVETYNDVVITPNRMPRSTTLRWYAELTFPQLVDMIQNLLDHEAYYTAHLLINEMVRSSNDPCGGFWAERSDKEYLSALMRGVGVNDDEAEISLIDVVDLTVRKGEGHFVRISAEWRPLTVDPLLFWSNHHLFWRNYWRLRQNRIPIAPELLHTNPHIRWENKTPSFFELYEPAFASMSIRKDKKTQRAASVLGKYMHKGPGDLDQRLIDVYSIIDIKPIADSEDYSEKAIKAFYKRKSQLKRHYERKLY